MNDAAQFAGKRVLVVGATGMLGGAICRLLAARGAALVLSGRNRQRLDDLAQATGGAALPADLAESGDRDRLVAELPTLDGCVHAAGVAPVAPVKYLKEKDAEDSFRINAILPLLLVRDLLKRKRIKDGASLVWFSSLAAGRGSAGYAAYAGAKAAVEASARCLAIELAPRRIRVNCIAPGMIPGEMADAAAAAVSRESVEGHFRAYPLGVGRPDDVARGVAFLLADDSRWTTGAVLPVDGGFRAK